MSYNSLLISELEQKIGLSSGNPTVFLSIDSEKRLALRGWLVAKGIDTKTANKSSDETLSKAYKSPAYLAAMLRNVKRSRTYSDTSEVDFDFEDEAPSQKRTPNASIFNETQSKTDEIPPNLAHKIAQAADLVITPRIASAKRDLENQIDHKIKNAKLELSSEAKLGLKQLVTEIATEVAAQTTAALLPPRRIEIEDKSTDEIRDVGLCHFKFETLLRVCQTRLPSGFKPNIWLTGPTGSGKTTAGEQVAKALDLPFGADGSLDADYKVLGFKNAQGDFMTTTFLQIYEGGGVYIADEIDNWLPSALLSLNSALANGWVSTPKGMVKRHPDCLVIACANTWGLGATNDYVGRTKLDAASLNRFLPKIDWPIDEKLERELSRQHGEIAVDWCNLVQLTRAKAKVQGLHIIISPRDTLAGIALLRSGFTFDEVTQMTFAAGLKPEQIKALGIESRQEVYEEQEKKAIKHAYAYGV